MSLAWKFTSLLLKTISKPIANVIKVQAKEHPSFRQLCINFAQVVHRADINMRRKLLNEKEIKVRPLNDAKAIQNGANFLADSFVFGVGGGLILFEYYRSAKKEAQRRATVADDIKVLQDEINWLQTKLLEKRVLTAADNDYVVPDGVEPSVLHLRRRDGHVTGESNASATANTADSQKAAAEPAAHGTSNSK